MQTSTNKIGHNRGRRRIWLDGQRLKNAGFVGGQQYYLTKTIYNSFWKNELVLHFSPTHSTFDKEDINPVSGPHQIRKVKCVDGKPIIDIVGQLVKEVFNEYTHVDVEYQDCRIVITPHLDRE